MILLTSCLQKLEQLKDKLRVFENIQFNEESSKKNANICESIDDQYKQESEEEVCTFHL
jgi:hypothetical protein